MTRGSLAVCLTGDILRCGKFEDGRTSTARLGFKRQLPAKRLGMRTALFAGDAASLEPNTWEQLQDPGNKPDILVTDLSQIADVVLTSR